MESLPEFRYHPDPIATGAIEVSKDVCECCGKARGYRYAASIYGTDEVQTVCPWCIADGSVAARFDATFVEDHPLRLAGIPDAIIDEITMRTPGYVSWQQEVWMCCCGDACEFRGDAPRWELDALDTAAVARLSAESGLDVETLRGTLRSYEPCGSPAFYKFVCRHCGATRYHCDFD